MPPSVQGTPILHKRHFRQPGESEFVQAKPQPSGNHRNTNNHRGQKGSFAPFGEREGANRGAREGNLISLDDKGNHEGN